MVNILLVTSHFPPQHNAGANRPYSLYKYLPKGNITSFVITKQFNSDLKNNDQVYYSDSLINWRETKPFSVKRLFRYLSFIRYYSVSIYLDKWWMKSAVKDGSVIIRKQKIDLIYATFPGIEALAVGLKLSSKCGIPLIAEFRDGLVFESLYRNFNFIQKRSAEKIEAKVVKQSAAIITIANTISHYFRKCYGKGNVYTVYNGYDDDDFPQAQIAESLPPPKKKLIYHFGNLNLSRAADRSGLFEALSFLKERGEIQADIFKVVFVGKFSADELQLIKKNKLEDIVVLKSYMPKREGIREIITEASGLLFYGVKDEGSIVSSKLPEYIRMNKPILGICEGNEAANIIRDTHTGLVSDFDIESIVAMFRSFMNGQFEYKPDQKKITFYSRKKQAQQIADIIIKTVKNNE